MRSMQNKFSALIKQYRTNQYPNKLSQQYLADSIGKTKQYINLLENDSENTPPPSLEICLQLAKTLGLNEAETDQFLYEAFKYRIKNNWNFYSHLSERLNRSSLRNPDSESLLHPQGRRPMLESCYFRFDWQMHNQYAPFSEEMQHYTQETIRSLAEKMQQQVLSFRIQGNNLSLIAELSARLAPKEFITGLQQLSSSAIKSQFPQLVISTPSIWKKELGIQSLSRHDCEQMISPHTVPMGNVS
mgnify:CR=1 FL=1